MIETLITLVITVAVLGFIVSFHWTRIVFGGLGMLAWGVIAAVAPIYLIVERLAQGDIGAAILTLFGSAVVFAIWAATAYGCWQWYQREQRWGSIWTRPWNSR